ncbi:MAG TPA: FAD:protein FMN transferase [Candidatus Sulfomarinibacteraceae bacterium]|nr:FAD:protein FMN transferase [Candidatus Sulfomarinibacteraceae bacterium]
MSPRTVEPPPLRRLIVPALFVGALFVALLLRQPDGPGMPDQWVITGSAMGTGFTVKVVVPEGADVSQEGVAAAVREVVDEVDRAMSTYLPDSELSRFNRHGTDPFPASDALREVISEALRVARLSDGAFDITVGPLVDAWGFGPTPRDQPPGEVEIAALLAATGSEYLVVDPERGTLRKLRPGLGGDLSAIAKGYGVDRVAERLLELGLGDHMVEIGGEVRAAGVNADGQVWRIGVERPEPRRRSVWTAVPLADLAMATSGDYRNYVESDGVRISHTIDPRTGRPISHSLASVTVLHPSCMTADALATALNVLGPDQARALADREGLAVLLLVRDPAGSFGEWTSDGWVETVGNTGDAEDVVSGEEI